MDSKELSVITACQSGDMQQFSFLYEQYVQKIYSFIFHKTFHKETAEDLTSQTFLKALQGISTFDAEKSQFSTWIFTIARNTVFDFFRTHKSMANIDDVWDIDAGVDLIEDQHLASLYAKVKESLQHLSVQQREILMLRFWQDLSYKEIALLLQKSEASVKMDASRGIQKLKKDFLLFCFLSLFF